MVTMCVETLLRSGGARPDLSTFLHNLVSMRKAGNISEIWIWTSTPNTDGTVDFLVKCIEEFVGIKGVFDGVKTRGARDQVHNGRIVKDLQIFSDDANNVVLVDDKPENALNGYCIRVDEYRREPSAEQRKEVRNWLCELTNDPGMIDFIDRTLEKDSARYPTQEEENEIREGDNGLLGALKIINELFCDARPAKNATVSALPTIDEELVVVDVPPEIRKQLFDEFNK